MSLPDEIRQVLSKMYTRAGTIRWRVGQDRIKREDYSKLPSLKRFTNVLAEMPDVEAGVDKGKRVWRRKSVEIEEHTFSFHLRGMLFLITGLMERLYNQLTRIKSCKAMLRNYPIQRAKCALSEWLMIFKGYYAKLKKYLRWPRN